LNSHLHTPSLDQNIKIMQTSLEEKAAKSEEEEGELGSSEEEEE
jgi:hypothetical protein